MTQQRLLRSRARAGCPIKKKPQPPCNGEKRWEQLRRELPLEQVRKTTRPVSRVRSDRAVRSFSFFSSEKGSVSGTSGGAVGLEARAGG